MDDEGLSDAAVFGQMAEPPFEVLRVRVSRKAVEHFDVCSHIKLAIKDPNFRLSFLKTTAERVFGLIANQHNRVSLTTDCVP